MYKLSIKTILFNGIALALPLAVVAYIVFRFFVIFEKMVLPAAKLLHIATVFGELTLTILAILLMLFLAFFLGLLMQISYVSNSRKLLEDLILKIIPSLNNLKLIAAEKLETGDAAGAWKPVLLEYSEGIIPSYLIEETETLATFSKVKIPGTEPGEIVILRKDSMVYTEISISQLRIASRQFGKGLISLIEK